MGFRRTLKADENFIGAEFTNAYFKLTNFGFGEFEGNYIVAISLSGFASREAAALFEKGEEVPGSIGVGASARTIYDPELYRWNGQFLLKDVYPDGVPSSLSEAKAEMYKFLKKELKNINFEDVFEEGQA